MSSKNFCNNLGTELEAWTNIIENIAKKFESKPGYAKAGVLENIEDIHILVEELHARIHQLQETCSLDGFDHILTERERDMRAQINTREAAHAVAEIGGGNFGG